MSDFISPEKFKELKAMRYDSLKEYIAMLAAAPGSLKAGLIGEELATEIIKGALLIKRFIETGALPPSPKNC
jgi:hypothetical protein